MILVISGAHGDRSVLEGYLSGAAGPAPSSPVIRGTSPFTIIPAATTRSNNWSSASSLRTPKSLSLFSGFRGSGKTTELFRLQKRLQEMDYTVLYADALDYVNPAAPIEISDLLIILAGAFSDALQEMKIDVSTENYWTRI
jgi:hypothetical protein